MPRVLFYSIVLLLLSVSGAYSSTPDLSPYNSKVLAVVPISRGSIDKDVYRHFDKLVPELKKISKDNIIKLECRYSGQPDRERDVIKAYQLAGQIEKYLRERHKLDLDLWITISMGQKKSNTLPNLTIAVFADDIKQLDSIPIYSKPDKQSGSSAR